MAKNDNQKRVSLYFNLEVEDEYKMWEHLSKKKKSNYIKNLIQNDMKGTNFEYKTKEVDNDPLDGIDIDNDAINFD